MLLKISVNFVLSLAFCLFMSAASASQPLRVVYAQSGPQVFDQEVYQGLRLGFEYATEAEWKVGERAIFLSRWQIQSDTVEDLEREFLALNADIVIAPMSSTLTDLLIDFSEKNNRTLLIPSSQLDTSAMRGNGEYYFRTGPGLKDYVQGQLNLAAQLGKPIQLLAPDYDSVKELLNHLQKIAQDSDEAFSVAYYPAKTRDFRFFIDKARKDVPKATRVIIPLGAELVQKFKSAFDRDDLVVRVDSLQEQQGLIDEPLIHGIWNHHYSSVSDENWLNRTHLVRYKRLPSNQIVIGADTALAITAAFSSGVEIDGVHQAFQGLRFNTTFGSSIIEQETLFEFYGAQVVSSELVDGQMPWGKLVNSVSLNNLKAE